MIDVHSGLIHYLIDERWWAIPMWNPRYFSGALLEMIGARFLRRDHFAGNERWTEKTTGDAQKCGHVHRERDDEPLGSVVHCFQTDSRRGLMIGFGIFCAGNSGSCWNVRPAHFCTWEEKLADVAARIEVECETCWCLYSREWGNGMIVSSYCGSFSHSLLSTSKEMVSLYDLHFIT